MENNPHQKNLRCGRFQEKGFYYFITTIAKNREKVFLQPPAAKIVMDSLKWLDDKNRISLLAAVVMPDHLHFVAELKEVSLGGVMHSLKSFTANEINKALGRNGPLWERQYYEHGIRDVNSLMGKIKYCLMNPVRRGFVEDFKSYDYWYCKYEM